MRISIRTQLISLLVVVLVGTTGLVLTQTIEIYNQDKSDFIQDLTTKISSSTSKRLSDRLKSFDWRLRTFVSQREVLAKTGARDSSLKKALFENQREFLSVAFLQKPKGSWESKWFELNPSLEAAKWPETFSQTLLTALPAEDLKAGKLEFVRLSQPEGQPLVGVLTSLTSETAIFALLDSRALSDVVVDFKGALTSVFVVDRKGGVYAHPDSHLEGITIGSHPVVSAMTSTNQVVGMGEYSSIEGEVWIGGFQEVEGSNLSVIVATPKKEAFSATHRLTETVLFCSAIFLLMGLALIMWFSSKWLKTLAWVSLKMKEAGEANLSNPLLSAPKNRDEFGDLVSNFKKMRMSLSQRDEALGISQLELLQKEKMAAFGQLSAGIAHEVKNPLAGILGHAQLAKGKADNPEVKKHLDTIERETRRTKEIIENLMQFARGEKQKFEATDIHESINRSLDLMTQPFEAQGVKVFKKLISVPSVLGNSNQLQQVLVNLFQNSIHAMESSDSKELHVNLEDRSKEGFVRVSVRDTGRGMTEEVKAKIFEPFFTTKAVGKGTGLGLAVSYGIITGHNGNITVETQVGKGTTFFVDLPIANEQKTTAFEPALPPDIGFPPNPQSEEDDVFTVTKPSSQLPHWPKRPTTPPPAAKVSLSDFYPTLEVPSQTKFSADAKIPEMPDFAPPPPPSEKGELGYEGYAPTPQESERFKVKIRNPKMKD